jgi:hypothetical protein
MSTVSAAVSLERPKAYRVILWGGLIAGALDLTAACVNNVLRGRNAIGVFKAIASGLLGAEVFENGFAFIGSGLVRFT